MTPDQNQDNFQDDSNAQRTSNGMRIQDPNQAEQLENEHIIPGANPPKNEHQRGGFGVRMGGQQGYGSDSANGVTALSTNEPDDASDTNRATIGNETPEADDNAAEEDGEEL